MRIRSALKSSGDSLVDATVEMRDFQNLCRTFISRSSRTEDTRLRRSISLIPLQSHRHSMKRSKRRKNYTRPPAPMWNAFDTPTRAARTSGEESSLLRPDRRQRGGTICKQKADRDKAIGDKNAGGVRRSAPSPSRFWLSLLTSKRVYVFWPAAAVA